MSTEVAVERTAERSSGELTHRQILTILGGLLLGMFLAALDQTVVSTAIRTIADDLGGLSEQAWATTAFLITSTISTPLYGKLSDIYGRKPLFLIAITVFVVGSVTCAFAGSMYQLAAFRALQGLGAGGLFSLALTILGDIVPPRERARYQGYFLAVFGTSSVLGPVIGGLLSGQKTIWFTEGWRWIFLVNVPIGLLAFAVVFKVLNVPHVKRTNTRIDWPGAIMLAVGLVPLLIIAEQGREWGWDSGRAWLCYGIGAFGLIIFVLLERYYKDDALLPLRLFRSSVFSLVTVVGVIVGMGMFGGIALLPQFLQIVHGATPIESGYLMLPLVGGIMIASIGSGQITSRTGKYKIFPVVGIFLMVSAMVIMYFRVSVDISLLELDLYMFMFGLGLGGCMQTLVLAVQNASPARDMGVVTASSTFFRQLGGTIGTAVFLSIVFSTVGGKITDAFAAARNDPNFMAAISDPAVRANPVNAPFFAAQAAGADSSVLQNSAFLQTVDPRLARPFLQGFSDSIVLTFIIVAAILAVAFILVLFVKELPLRTMSGAQAAAQEAAEAAAGPAGVSISKEAATSELATVGAAVTAPLTMGAAATEAERRDGRHAMSAYEPASANGHNGNGNGNGHHEMGDGFSAHFVGDSEPTPAQGIPAGSATQPGDGPEVYGVVNRGDGLGLPQVVVTVADPTGRQEARTATDATGAYRVQLQHGGTYLVVAAAGTYQPHAALVAVSDRPVRHDVSLTGTSAVLGTVRATDPTGGIRAVPGVTVTLIDVRGDVAAAGMSDQDGRYRLTGMPDGSYTLTAAGPGHQPVAVSLRLEVGAALERDLELPRRSRLLGTVTAASNGRGVPEAIATLVDSGGTVIGSTVTGPDGSFTFEDLSEGTYTLTASGYAPVAQVVQVTAGAQSTAMVELGTPGTSPLAPEGTNGAGTNGNGTNGNGTSGNGNGHQVGVIAHHVDVR